jgi:hypothetical protein
VSTYAGAATYGATVGGYAGGIAGIITCQLYTVAGSLELATLAAKEEEILNADFDSCGAFVVRSIAAGALSGSSVSTTIFGIITGREIVMKFGARKIRVAPFGNRRGHPTGRFPHYHRPRPHPNARRARAGESAPNQGEGRHRPWDTAPPVQRWNKRAILG